MKKKPSHSGFNLSKSNRYSFSILYRITDILKFLKENEEDQTIYQKFIRCLPNNVMGVLREDLSKMRKKKDGGLD